MVSRSRSVRALAPLLCLLASGSVSAQTVDASLLATRRGLIDQAREARTAGDHARALDLARRAGQIEMSPSLRRFVAESQESLGQFAEAMNTGELCAREGVGAQASHGDACRALIARVTPRVGRVVVTPPTPAPEGLRVRVGGNEIPAAVWGVPVVVTPGSVRVEAESPTHRAFSREVSVRAGATETVTFSLEALPVVVTAPPPPVVVTPPPALTPPPAVTPAPATAAVSNTGPFVLMGVGALGLGVAVTFLVLKGSGPTTACPNDPTDTTCPDVAAEDLYGGLAWGSLGVGVAGVAGGLIWFFMNRGSAQPAPRASLTGAMLPGGGTLGLRYTF